MKKSPRRSSKQGPLPSDHERSKLVTDQIDIAADAELHELLLTAAYVAAVEALKNEWLSLSIHCATFFAVSHLLHF